MEIIMRLISSVLKFTKRPSLLFIGKAIEYIQFTNGRIDIENTLKSLRVGELKPLILCIATALNASY